MINELEKSENQIEEALRESEEKYRVLFEAAPIGIGIADLEGNVLDANQSMQEMTCFTLEELRCAGVGAAYVDPDERKFLLKTLQETGRMRDWEVRLKRKDGTTYYALLNVDLLELGGHKVLLTTARDITERKRVEKEKERFLKAIDSSIDGISIADEKDRFSYVNEAYAMIFGYHQEELIGKTWHKITPPEMIAPIEKGLSNIMHNRDVGMFCGEFPGLRKDGTIVPTEVRGKGFWDEKGNYQGHICIVREITERKQIEETLRRAHDELEIRVQKRTAELSEQERFMSNIFSSIQDGLSILDNELNIKIVNPTMERWYAHSMPLSGKKCYQAYHGRNEPCEVCPSQRTLKTGEADYDVVPKRGAGGETIGWLDLYSFPLIDQSTGQIKGVIEYVRDITERKQAEESLKQSEEKYRMLIDNIQDGVFIIQDVKIQFANEAFARMGGYTVEEIIGKDFRELVAPEDLEMVTDRYYRRQAGEDVPHEYEFRALQKDGRTRILVNMNVGLITYRGRMASMGTVKDITEKKKLESQLRRAQRMESIGTLASGIAHDINNVLTPIMLSQELLREKFTDQESQRLLDAIERSSHRGADLMKQVMSYARGIEGERNALQVSHLISEIRQIAIETFPKSIEIRTSIQKDLKTISGDSTQLHQVLMNLCVNARDAMPDGGILCILAENRFIDESCARMNAGDKTGPYIVITVSDTGTGIPYSILDRIFEPFFTTKEHGKGTGLGLSTAVGIVKSHGGFITVWSEAGKGTTFKVYLPAITTPETLKAEKHQHELPAGHGESILVVDDEDQIREITRKTLEKYGYMVITASDGKEAVALYSQHRELIRAVLMDMMMPVMDGQASIRELHKINPEIKVIAVSGLNEKDKLTKVDDAHVQAFLTKPYTAEKLLNAIHDIILNSH